MRNFDKRADGAVMCYPSITLYTDNLPPDVGGCANGPIVRIRPKYRNDTGIHAHEAEHVRQWWVGVLLGARAALAISSIPSQWSDWWTLALIAGRATASGPRRAPTASSSGITRTTVRRCLQGLL